MSFNTKLPAGVNGIVQNEEFKSIFTPIKFEKPECNENMVISIDTASTSNQAQPTSTDRKTIYVCRFCFFQNSCASVVKSHEHDHTNVKPYQCNRCPFYGSNLSSLRGHQKRIHCSGPPLKCPRCSYFTYHNTSMEKHVRYCPSKVYECKLCLFTTGLKWKLKEHNSNHSSTAPFTCKYCHFKTSVKTDLLKHLKTHGPLEPYKCSECPYATTKKHCMISHKTKHEVSVPLRCVYCQYTTYFKCALKRHLKKHSVSEASKNPKPISTFKQTDNDTNIGHDPNFAANIGIGYQPNFQTTVAIGNNTNLAATIGTDHDPNFAANIAIGYQPNFQKTVAIGNNTNLAATIGIDHDPNLAAGNEIDSTVQSLWYQNDAQLFGLATVIDSPGTSISPPSIQFNPKSKKTISQRDGLKPLRCSFCCYTTYIARYLKLHLQNHCLINALKISTRNDIKSKDLLYFMQHDKIHNYCSVKITKLSQKEIRKFTGAGPLQKCNTVKLMVKKEITNQNDLEYPTGQADNTPAANNFATLTDGSVQPDAVFNGLEPTVPVSNLMTGYQSTSFGSTFPITFLSPEILNIKRETESPELIIP